MADTAAPTLTITVDGPHPATWFDFRGCTDRDPNLCACGTHDDVHCTRCDQPIRDGQLILTTTRTWAEDGEWLDLEVDAKHLTCPPSAR